MAHFLSRKCIPGTHRDETFISYFIKYLTANVSLQNAQSLRGVIGVL